MTFRGFAGAALLFAWLMGVYGAKAQDRRLVPPPLPTEKTAADTASVQAAEAEQQLLLHRAVAAVIQLEANGDRTMEAIENTEVTLTLGTIADGSRLSVLCLNGGQPLRAFTQMLLVQLELEGKVTKTVCTGSGRDADPFILKSRLHFESHETGLFTEVMPEQPFVVVKFDEEGPDGRVGGVEREETSRELRSIEPSLTEPPLKPVLLNPERLQTSHTAVQLAQGWTPVELPAPMHADSAFGTFDSSVSFTDGVLTCDRKLLLKRDKVEVAELPAYQEWMNNLEPRTRIPLRSTSYYPDRDASGGTAEQKKAADLINEAYNAIKTKDFGKAEAALKQAELLDPGREILHENRGELAEARGDFRTALAEYRKELEAYPEALIEMGSIAGAQTRLGDQDGSILTLERWMHADPNSNFPAIRLMAKYHDMGRDDRAVQVGDEAIGLMTRDAKRSVNFLLSYGRAQMRAGQAQNARSTLEALLDLTVDDRVVNDAAYLLSEQGLDLDRAEEATREALTQFEPDEAVTGLSTSYAYGGQSDLLLATWDTLGWILYRKGNLREAEGYVRAAWRSRQDPAICRHLGEILIAEEKPVEAMDVYTLGLRVMADGNAAQVAKDPDAIAIRASVAELKQKGHAPSVTDATAALAALRTLDLGPAQRPERATVYQVNLSRSELEVYPAEQDTAEELNVVIDPKLLAEFFPPESKASLRLKGKVQCGKSCSLVFLP